MSAKNKIVIYNPIAVLVFLKIIDFHLQIISAYYIPNTPTSPRDIWCYKMMCYDECDQMLPIVDNNFHALNKTIYFIETSCRGGLQSRAACSVESAARANPNWHIVVMFAGPPRTEFWKSSTFSTLISMPNVYFYRLYPTEVVQGTLIEEVYLGKLMSKSLYSVVHSADLLRLLILHKYGGLYLDLDILVMKSFDSLPDNFIAQQHKGDIGSGIIAVTKDGIGHEFAELSMRDVSKSYNPRLWAGSTNDLYTRTLRKICSTNKISEMNEQTCQGFHVLSQDLFYPVPYSDWFTYYTPGNDLPRDTEAFTHHLWNSYGSQVNLDRNSSYVRLAQQYCPQMYDLYKDQFGQ